MLSIRANLFFMATAVLFFCSCKKETIVKEHEGEAAVTFNAVVGAEDFSLNKTFSIGNREYNFSQLRYWVSNIVLTTEDGVLFEVPDSYFLLEETGPVAVQDGAFQYPAKKREAVVLKNIPQGNYKKIKFSVGVDQVHNDNLSLQTGELSQLNGMTNISWMWHTSYIFSSLKGTVKEGAAAAKNIKVETGLNVNYKTVSLTFPERVRISSAKSSSVEISVDVARMIEGVDLVATPTVGASQVAQMQTVAGNFETKVFAVKALK